MGVKEISSITASLALVCTGLIAYAPAEVPTQLSSPAVQLASVLDDIVPPGTDPFDWITVVQSIMGYGQSQIGQGLADIAQGDLVAGLSDITRGVNNVVFSPLEDAFLGVLQNAVHQLPVWYVIDDGSLPPPAFPPTDLADLATNLQWMLQTTQSLIANGFDDLGRGVIGGGVGQIVQGLDGIFIKIPESLLLGPLFVALNAVADPGGIPGGPNAVVEAIQDIADRGETQISDGFTDFAQGNVIEGMWNLNSGLSNLLVGVPQNALIATIDTLFGDMVLYPSTSLHRVTPVTRGARVASFFWIESLVADEGERALLYDLDQSIQALTPVAGPTDPQLLKLTYVYHNLLRRWAVT